MVGKGHGISAYFWFRAVFNTVSKKTRVKSITINFELPEALGKLAQEEYLRFLQARPERENVDPEACNVVIEHVDPLLNVLFLLLHRRYLAVEHVHLGNAEETSTPRGVDHLRCAYLKALRAEFESLAEGLDRQAESIEGQLQDLGL